MLSLTAVDTSSEAKSTSVRFTAAVAVAWHGGGSGPQRAVGHPPLSLKEPGFWVFCFSSLKHEKASAWLFNLRRGLSPDEAVLFSLLPLRSQPAFDGTSKAQRAQET